MSHTCTVATYLKTRLEQLGLDRMFGVAGNYTAALLAGMDEIVGEDEVVGEDETANPDWPPAIKF